MTKGIVFGDTHIDSSHEFSRPTRDGFTVRLLEHIECYEWIAREIRERRPDFVVNNGDIIHRQGIVESEVIEIASKCESIITAACEELGIEYFVSIGNHDKKSDDASVVKSTGFLKYFRGVTFIESPTVINGMAFIPHTVHKSKLAEAMPKLQGSSIAFTHLDIVGARFHATQVDKHGFSPDALNFSLIVNGHYHLPQVVSKTIIHPGAPQEWSLREPKGEIKRGILEVNTEDGVNWTYQHIENKTSPRFVTVESLTQIPSLRQQDYHLIKVLFKSDLAPYAEELKDIRHIVEVKIDRQKSFSIDENNAIDLTTTVEQDVVTFIEAIETPLDRDKLIKTGINLTQKV